MAYDYKTIVPYLLDWYDYNARILPWRENPKPYHVWISEIMLQQTRVEAVRGYFDRFINEIPSIDALAKVEDEKLLKLWEGLGYYNRARNLKKAAWQIVRDYGGELPADYNELLKLPGIGSYTAGAIASIAFQIPVAAVDGNVLRITKRIAGSFDDITKEKVKRELSEDLNRIIPKDRPGDFNQSLMDLGATVCLPNGKPLCQQCPLMHLCEAYHKDYIAQIPVKPPKKKRKIEQRTILLMEYQDKYLLHQRAAKGLLAGLWELPGIEEKLSSRKLRSILNDKGLEIASLKTLGEAKHIFSHIEWHMTGYYINLSHLTPEYIKENSFILADEEEIKHTYTLPSAFSPFLDQTIDKRLGNN
ncbi:MAG: A/G-specific adenine glycosylase [Clostridiales bacterium]|jgi:A/G-specific adenine glycosylase|nr:A/G-specific adenine glycosylase [Clostridiales bacterium]